MSFNKALIVAVIIIGVVTFVKYKINIKSLDSENHYVEEDISNDFREAFTIRRSDYHLASFSAIKRSRTPEKILIRTTTTDKREIPVKLKNILYCESSDGKAIIYLDKKDRITTITTSMTLKELKKEIAQPDFMYEKLQSYIINFDYVEELIYNRTKGTKNYKPYIVTNGNDDIYIPAAKFQDFRTAFKKYLSKNTLD